MRMRRSDAALKGAHVSGLVSGGDYNQWSLGIVENELPNPGRGDETHEAQSRERPERHGRSQKRYLSRSSTIEFEFSGSLLLLCDERVAWPPGRCDYHLAIIPAFPASKQRVHVERTQSVKTEMSRGSRGAARRSASAQRGQRRRPTSGRGWETGIDGIGGIGQCRQDRYQEMSYHAGQHQSTVSTQPTESIGRFNMDLRLEKKSVSWISIDIGERRMNLPSLREKLTRDETLVDPRSIQ